MPARTPVNEGRAAVSERLDFSVDPEIDGSPTFISPDGLDHPTPT